MRHVSLILVAGTFCVAGMLVRGDPALAQAVGVTPTAVPTTTVSATSVAAVSPAASGAPLTDEAQLLVAVALFLAFAVIVIGLMFRYLYSIQRPALDLMGDLARAGVPAEAGAVPALGSSGPRGAQAGDGGMQIFGPSLVYVGAPSPEFAYQQTDGTRVDATWAVEPADMVDLHPATAGATATATVRVVAKRQGQFTLRAINAARGNAELPVGAVNPRLGGDVRSRIPFVGESYGAIILAVIALSVIGVLALAGVIHTEGVTALLGALFGYIFFGIGSGGGGSSRSGGGQSPSGGGSTGTS